MSGLFGFSAFEMLLLQTSRRTGASSCTIGISDVFYESIVGGSMERSVATIEADHLFDFIFDPCVVLLVWQADHD